MKRNNSFFKSKTGTALIHFFIWACVFSFPFILRTGNPDRSELDYGRFIMLIMFPLGFLFSFYCNAYLLIPKILYKNKTWLYFATLLIIGLAFVYIHGLIHLAVIDDTAHYRRGPHKGSPFSLWPLFPYAFVFAISASYRIFKDRSKEEKNKQEKENETLKTELSFLRSQVSPHFMFNVMNSIVYLSRKKSDMLEPVVIKLSELLRYMLYDSDEEKVGIEKEINYLNSFIDLQKLRFGESVKVNFIQHTTDSSCFIEPMLLIPFVENAFKHGVVMIDNPSIEISLHTNSEELILLTKNKYNPDSKEEKDKNSGIGLNNVKRRLNLLYPGKHSLSIKDNGNTFEVELKIFFK